MNTEIMRPSVGIGVFIRKDGKILMGKRKGSFGGGTWALPGGHLEMGETLEDCVVREISEETGLEIQNIKFITAQNNIFDDGKPRHFVTLLFSSDWKSGEPKNLEPDKCERWEWFTWGDFPEPLFIPTRDFIKTRINPLEI